MRGSFNTREFFHPGSAAFFEYMKWIFLLLAFPLPLTLLWIGLATESSTYLLLAFMIQYVDLIAERWCFFANANHPKNLYYQTIS